MAMPTDDVRPPAESLTKALLPARNEGARDDEQRTWKRPHLGSLGSAEGKGIVRMEDRLDTDIDDVWSALTDPSRLARWYGEVEGDLRPGGEYRVHLFASGWEGSGRVEACEPSQRLLVRIKDADEPDEHDIELTLTADDDQTIVIWEERGMPWTSSPLTGPGCSSMLKISPTTSAGVSAATTPRRGGTSSTLPIRTWRPTTANDTSGGRAAWASVGECHRAGFEFACSLPGSPEGDEEAALAASSSCRATAEDGLIYSIGISKRAMMPGSPPLASSSGSGSRVATHAYPCSG